VITFTGMAGADRLDGGAGNDYLLGGIAKTDFTGMTASDSLYGGDGDYYLEGGMAKTAFTAAPTPISWMAVTW